MEAPPAFAAAGSPEDQTAAGPTDHLGQATAAAQGPGGGTPALSAVSVATAAAPALQVGGDGAAVLTHEQLQNAEQDYEMFHPPENFNMICRGVYRSAFPKKKNFPFLKKLGLKSILTLILEEYPEQNMRFLEQNNIKLLQFGVAGNKEPFVDIPEDKICLALAAMLDKRNLPMLLHCNKGKHRTGCLVGCLRKLQRWSYTSIFDEYRRFSHPKSRSMDQQFIELFNSRKVWSYVDVEYLPDWVTYG